MDTAVAVGPAGGLMDLADGLGHQRVPHRPGRGATAAPGMVPGVSDVQDASGCLHGRPSPAITAMASNRLLGAPPCPAAHWPAGRWPARPRAQRSDAWRHEAPRA